MNKSILGYNLYLYVNNNPVNATDTSGEFLKKVCNWVKDKYQKVTKAIIDAHNYVKSIINDVKESIKNNLLVEVETGFGFDTSIGKNSKKIGGGFTKTFGFRYADGETIGFTSTSGSIQLGNIVDYSLDIRDYDNTSNPMTIIGNNTEISGSLSAMIDKEGKFSASEDSDYATVTFSLFKIIGLRVKVGWKKI